MSTLTMPSAPVKKFAPLSYTVDGDTVWISSMVFPQHGFVELPHYATRKLETLKRLPEQGRYNAPRSKFRVTTTEEFKQILGKQGSELLRALAIQRPKAKASKPVLKTKKQS